jgi:hypothetical protein
MYKQDPSEVIKEVVKFVQDNLKEVCKEKVDLANGIWLKDDGFIRKAVKILNDNEMSNFTGNLPIVNGIIEYEAMKVIANS